MSRRTPKSVVFLLVCMVMGVFSTAEARLNPKIPIPNRYKIKPGEPIPRGTNVSLYLIVTSSNKKKYQSLKADFLRVRSKVEKGKATRALVERYNASVEALAKSSADLPAKKLVGGIAATLPTFQSYIPAWLDVVVARHWMTKSGELYKFLGPSVGF